MAQKLGIAMNDKTNSALEALSMGHSEDELQMQNPILFKGQMIDIDEN